MGKKQKEFDQLQRHKTIRDAVHFDIDFDRDEVGVMNTREFQRLRRIKQLGMSYLVYPSASHSRFEHVLGVCHMAQRIMDNINHRGREVLSPEDRKIVRWVALLHDIGHVPFGHTLEDERPVFMEKHDESKRLEHFLFHTSIATEMEKVERELGLKDLRKTIMRVLSVTRQEGSKASPKEKLFADIVGNTICADLLDYLKRDTLFTGIQHRYDDRIISSFSVSDSDQLFIDLTDDRSVRTGLVSEILHLLTLRYTLGERVYYHPTKAAASAMMSKAVELAGLCPETLYDLGDDELLYLLENPEIIDAKKLPVKKDVSGSGRDAAKRIAGQIRRRAMYVPVYRITRREADDKHRIKDLVKTYHDPAEMSTRRKVEEEIGNACELAEGQVIINCPHSEMSLKEAGVKVRFSRELELETLQSVPDTRVTADISALVAKHEALWSLEVFLDAEEVVNRGMHVAIECQKHLGMTNNIEEFVPSGQEYVAVKALFQAIEDTTKDFSIAKELLDAVHRKGRDSLTKPQQWKDAFPEKFERHLFEGESHGK